MASTDHPNPTDPQRGLSRGGPDGEEPPLDPAMERVRRRLVRLLIGSFAIMILGLIAVFSTIVYRLNDGAGDGAPAGPAPSVAEIALPAGSEILSTSISGQRTLVHIAVPGRPHGQLIVIETDSGLVIGRFNLSEVAAD